MKVSYPILLTCLALLVTSYCKRNNYSLQNTSEHYLRFGSGGGFTGASTSYTLMENGQFFQHESLRDTTLILPRVKRKTCTSLFKELKTLDKGLFGIQQPGNRYYFLEWVTPEEQLRSTWGANTYTPPTELEAIYQKLMVMVQTKD